MYYLKRLAWSQGLFESGLHLLFYFISCFWIVRHWGLSAFSIVEDGHTNETKSNRQTTKTNQKAKSTLLAIATKIRLFVYRNEYQKSSVNRKWKSIGIRQWKHQFNKILIFIWLKIFTTGPHSQRFWFNFSRMELAQILCKVCQESLMYSQDWEALL